MENQKKQPISLKIKENITRMEEAYRDCADIKKKPMMLGVGQDVEAYLIYIEVTVDTGTSVLGETLRFLNGKTREGILSSLEKNALAISDATFFPTIEEAIDGVLTGETILFVDGFDKALKIPDGGYPSVGVSETDSEKAVRGSNEGLCESVKLNAAMIRKRIRSPKVKVRQLKIGVRSNTNVYVMYIEDLAKQELLQEVEKRLSSFEIDGVLDSGILEQLSEKSCWCIIFYPI